MCWFYLVAFYLYRTGYEIKEFPRLLARPPIKPCDFTYSEIRSRIIELGGGSGGVVPYDARRVFVSGLTFELKLSHIRFDDSISQKFVEISNRSASFDEMPTDEKLSEISNLIENMLKKGKHFAKLDYSQICFEYITDKTVSDYRRKMHCFRHASNEAIAERDSYSYVQKNFLVDYGITIIKVIHELTNGAQAS